MMFVQFVRAAVRFHTNSLGLKNVSTKNDFPEGAKMVFNVVFI